MFLVLALCVSSREPQLIPGASAASALSSVPVALVMAFRADSPFCRDLLPHFRAACAESDSDCAFALLEWSDAAAPAFDALGIFAFPSLFVFRYGRRTAEYTGARTAAHMRRFAARIAGAAVADLSGADAARAFAAAHRAYVVLAGDDADAAAALSAAADALRDEIAIARADADAAAALGIDELPSLRLRRADDRCDTELPLAIPPTADALAQWVRANAAPRYRARDGVTFRDMSLDARRTVLAFVDTTKEASLDALHAAMGAAVDRFGARFTYAYCDVYEDGALALALGFSGTREPMFALVALEGGRVAERALFPERDAPAPDAVVRWIEGAAPRSEPEPENGGGAARKLVGTTFAAAMGERERDIVCLLLAGDEGRREEAQKALEGAAREFERQRVDSVGFFYIDMEKNDVDVLRGMKVEKPRFVMVRAGGEAVELAGGGAEELAKEVAAKSASRYSFRISGDEVEENEL